MVLGGRVAKAPCVSFFLEKHSPPPFLFFALSVIVSLSPSALKPNLSFLSPPKMKNKNTTPKTNDSYRDFCWFSFSHLLDSVESGLKPLGFLHLLPGHGRSGSWASLERKDAAIDELLDRERAADVAAAAKK